MRRLAIILSALACVAQAPAAPTTQGADAATAARPDRPNPFLPLDGMGTDRPSAPGATPSSVAVRSALPSVAAADSGAPPAVSAAPAQIRLGGILYCNTKPMVIIADRIYCAGDEIGEWRIETIGRDQVLLGGAAGRCVMTVRQPDLRPCPATAADAVGATSDVSATGGNPPAATTPASTSAPAAPAAESSTGRSLP